MADIEYHLYNEANDTLVAQLTPATHGIGVEEDLPSFQKVGHDAGTASFALPLDSPVLPTLGQVLRVKVMGSWWEAWRVVGLRNRPVAPDEEVGELLRVTLRSLIVDDERAVVQRNVDVSALPAYTDRVEGWMGPTFTESGSWVAATSVAVQGWGSAFYTGLPSGWSDPSALWMSDGYGDHTDAPAGTRRFRHSITLAADVENAVLQVSMDNWGEAYFDGHDLGAVSSWQEYRQFELGYTTAGTHLLALNLVNAADDGPPGGNPTGALWVLRDGIDGAVLARSGTSAHVLPYSATAPTVTEGLALLNLFDDSPSLASRSCTFTASTDSDSASWPGVERIQMQVGSTVAAWLRDRASTTIDFQHHADGTFSAWAKGGRGSTVSVDLIAAQSTAGIADPTTVNINDLEWESDDSESYDALLVQHDQGFAFRPEPPASDATFGFLKVQGTATEAVDIADGILDAYGSGLDVATLEYLPVSTSDWPGVLFDVWDVIPVPTAADLDVTSNQRVRAVTLKIDAEGQPSWLLELGSLWRERVELLQRKAQSDGAVEVESAQRVSVASASIAPPRTSTVVIASVSIPDISEPDSGYFNFPNTCRVMWVRCTAKTPSGTTTLAVRQNGSTIATLSMGAAATEDYEDTLDLTTLTTDDWDVEFSAVGGHTRVTVVAGIAPVGT